MTVEIKMLKNTVCIAMDALVKGWSTVNHVMSPKIPFWVTQSEAMSIKDLRGKSKENLKHSKVTHNKSEMSIPQKRAYLQGRRTLSFPVSCHRCECP